MTTIGDQDGITAGANRLRDLDPKGTLLKKGSDGKWPNMWDELKNVPVEDWKAWDKWQRSFQILVDDHDSPSNGGGDSGYVPPPDSSLAQLAKNVVFCAQNAETALQSPHKYSLAITADPAYAGWATQSLVDQAHAQGRLVFAWGVQTQIPPQSIVDLCNRLGMDGSIGQAETQEEYDTAIAFGFGIIVGNPNAWNQASRDDANKRIDAGTLAVIGEDYANLGGPPPNQYSAGGVGIASVCIGVYDGTHEQPGSGWDPSVKWYKDNCSQAMWNDIGVYHAAGVDPAEWPLLA
jgi:hypothetical protein